MGAHPHGADGLTPYWPVPRLWTDRTAFVLAGGPSLRGFDFDRLRGREVIAVNAAGYEAPWAPVLFFGDNAWGEANQPLVGSWPGLVCTVSLRSAERGAAVRLVQVVDIDRGFPTRGLVRRGRSSGHTAVALAIAMGAARVVLLGFDMRSDDEGRTHYHDRYERRTAPEQLVIFQQHFAGWRDEAGAIGVSIVNATPGSALTEFPMVDINDELGDALAA